MTEPYLSLPELLYELTINGMTPDEATRRMAPPTPKNTAAAHVRRAVQRQTQAMFAMPPEAADSTRRDLAGDNSWINQT